MSKIKITYDFLKKHDLILFECIVGSQAYATNIETSDIDKKFIYCLPEDYILGFNYLDFIEVNPDYTGWEVKSSRAVGLLILINSRAFILTRRLHSS